VRAAAISHALDYDKSREWFRVHTYMDDFGCVVVDDPEGWRFKLARDALAAIGKEMGLPFGAEKWEAAAPLRRRKCHSASGSTPLTRTTPPDSCLTRAGST
jgi:hypothetical protein